MRSALPPLAATFGLTLAWGIAATPGAAQQRDFSNVRIETTDLGRGVYMLVGQGGNLGLSVGEDGAFLVDDQYAPLTERIQAAIASVTGESVRFVLNTHWHGDHTGGNENFGKAGAMIVAHRNVRRRLNPGELREVVGSAQQAPPDALPVITFTDEVDFHWNGQRIRVFHVPSAHTDGDAIVHFTGADVIHMGDTFFNGRYPFIDVDSGGDVDGVIAAADAGLELAAPSTRIIPGHGPLSGPSDLRAYRDMLATVRERVRRMKDEGASEDEVVARAPTADFDAAWGSGPERFVRAIYRSLGG